MVASLIAGYKEPRFVLDGLQEIERVGVNER